jgi:hypothetical protein
MVQTRPYVDSGTSRAALERFEAFAAANPDDLDARLDRACVRLIHRF